MLALLLLASTLLSAPAPPAAPAIDVYTFGPGAPLFERFGHAAVCIAPGDRTKPTLCYNYGTTDFSSPPRKIGRDFLMGRARFWVSVSSLDHMLASYVAADRTIWRQRLPLSPAAAERAAARLQHDALPENREYVYHHLSDNCSTRVRDVVDEATGGALTGGALTGAGPPLAQDSFRALGRHALRDQTLLIAIADLSVGRLVDRVPDAWQAMFLPDALRATIADRLGAAPELVYRRGADLPPAGAGSTGAWAVVLGFEAPLLLLPLALLARARPTRGRRIALRGLVTVVGVLAGAAGLALWTVAAMTTVPELRWNEALLILLPSDLALPFLPDGVRRSYARARAAGLLAVSLLAAVGLLHQPLLLPVLVLLLPFLILARNG